MINSYGVEKTEEIIQTNLNHQLHHKQHQPNHNQQIHHNRHNQQIHHNHHNQQQYVRQNNNQKPRATTSANIRLGGSY